MNQERPLTLIVYLVAVFMIGASVNIASATPVYTDQFLIDTLYDTTQANSAGMLIKPTGTPPSNSCNSNFPGWYGLDGSGVNYKTQSAMIMAAYLSGKKVVLGLDGCWWERPKIIAVYIYSN